MQDYISLVKNQIKSKKHVIITGDRGSGKTTLLQKILCHTEIGRNSRGLVTWCEPGKAVYMKCVDSDDKVMIGIFNPDSTSKENRMRPVSQGFSEYGVLTLQHFAESNAEWISIDEIGYLESSCYTYIEKLEELFEKKRVIAVVRKQETELIKKIVSRSDVLIIDLDKH